MTSLAEYTTREFLIPRLQSRTGAEAIAELCSRFQSECTLPGAADFCRAVLDRERLCSTASSPGWALPHARIRGLTRVIFALGLSPEPINWFGQTTASVRIVFLSAVPEDEMAGYLQLISSLARLSRDAVGLGRLLDSPGSEAMFEFLQSIRLPQPRAAAIRT